MGALTSRVRHLHLFRITVSVRLLNDCNSFRQNERKRSNLTGIKSSVVQLSLFPLESDWDVSVVKVPVNEMMCVRLKIGTKFLRTRVPHKENFQFKLPSPRYR